MPRNAAEQRLHMAVASFLNAVLPPDVPWSTFPSGGGGKARGGQLKAMGLKPGWPDVVVLVPPAAQFLGIEIKTKTGRLSAEQRAVREQIRKAGGFVMVARSIEEVEGILRGFSVPLRGSVAA